MGMQFHQSGFRPLEINELASVAGGDDYEGEEIVVTAKKLNDASPFSGGGSWGSWGGFSGGAFGLAGMAGMAQISGALANLLSQDTDQDGTPDFLDEDTPPDIVVVAPEMPEGYDWAEGNLGDKYLRAPDGSLVFNWSTALEVCEVNAALNYGLNVTGVEVGVGTALAGRDVNPTVGWLAGIFSTAYFGSQFAYGQAPQWCGPDGTSNYDPTVNYNQ